MSTRIALFLLAFSVPLLAVGQTGQNYRCTNADQIRRVEIAYVTGAAVPCEVRYYKDTEAPGAPAVPWNAQSQSGYCEARAEEFVSNLRSWGWSCTAVAMADPAVGDDTDALSSGGEP